MAKVGVLHIPAGLEAQYGKVFQDVSVANSPRVRRKSLFVSRKRKEVLLGQSLIPELSPVWASMTSADRDAWNSAGAACGYTGWRLFVRDTALRRQNGLTGYSTPNDLHQAMVGHINIQAPATSITLMQQHPQSYRVARKMRGTRSRYEPIMVQEDFALPLAIGISWRTALAAAGPNPRARFYCTITSRNNGQLVRTVCEVPFGLTDAWQRGSASISSVVGELRSYTAFIEAADVQGEIYFDNISLVHSGHEWARDPACERVERVFTKKLTGVMRHWMPMRMPSGAVFKSEYYTD